MTEYLCNNKQYVHSTATLLTGNLFCYELYIEAIKSENRDAINTVENNISFDCLMPQVLIHIGAKGKLDDADRKILRRIGEYGISDKSFLSISFYGLNSQSVSLSIVKLYQNTTFKGVDILLEEGLFPWSNEVLDQLVEFSCLFKYPNIISSMFEYGASDKLIQRILDEDIEKLVLIRDIINNEDNLLDCIIDANLEKEWIILCIDLGLFEHALKTLGTLRTKYDNPRMPSVKDKIKCTCCDF